LNYSAGRPSIFPREIAILFAQQNYSKIIPPLMQRTI
jgi:hypothetical protein